MKCSLLQCYQWHLCFSCYDILSDCCEKDLLKQQCANIWLIKIFLMVHWLAIGRMMPLSFSVHALNSCSHTNSLGWSTIWLKVLKKACCCCSLGSSHTLHMQTDRLWLALVAGDVNRISRLWVLQTAQKIMFLFLTLDITLTVFRVHILLLLFCFTTFAEGFFDKLSCPCRF